MDLTIVQYGTTHHLKDVYKLLHMSALLIKMFDG